MRIPFHTLGEGLTTEEENAARAYTSNSPEFHAFCQGIQRVYPKFPISEQVPSHVQSLESAVKKFQLASAMTVYCGVGWGLPVFGSLYSEGISLVGFRYQYPGFISTTNDRARAIQSFMCTGVNGPNHPTLLTISLPKDFKGLPPEVLGADNTHEREFILGRDIPFSIVKVTGHQLNQLCYSHTHDTRKVLELFLELQQSSAPLAISTS
jgi:hypothetical protein